MATTLPDQPLLPDNLSIDEKVSPNAYRDDILTNTGTQTARIHDELREAGSPNIEAEMLLRALRNVITPLVRPADREYKHDANQNVLGQEGREFVTALEKFMLSFLHSQRDPVGGIKVELEEKGIDIPNPGSQPTSNDDLSPDDVPVVAPQTEQRPDSAAPMQNKSQEDLGSMQVHTEELRDRGAVSIRNLSSISDTVTLKQQKSQFIETALNSLHEHVFNTMPIRMLCFKPHDSELRITLVERSEIYNHIASNLVGEYTGDDIDAESVGKKLITKYSRYAILSHTWLRGESSELTYGNWIRGDFDAQQAGYRKLVNFCRTAWIDHSINFGWMDTVCINKESSSELDESIRSMYKWYEHASVCITYLEDTIVLPNMHNDRWFTRGWTLQELLAPSYIKFYNNHWNKLVESDKNDKEDSVILKQIEEATTITSNELAWPLVLWIPISRKMQIAAKRHVTQEEDSAYSLMGIFDVSMGTAYGEGAERAFSRLLQEVLNSSSSDNVTDIFNWAGSYRSPISRLLPSSVQGYLHRSSIVNFVPQLIEPIMLTHLGLRITILIMPSISIPCPTESQYAPFGDYHAIVDIVGDFRDPLSFYLAGTIVGGSYSVLDARTSNSDGWNEERNWFQLALGVLNVGDAGNEKIMIPISCFAVALRSDYSSPQKILTEVPIIFTLNKRGGPDKGMDCYYIERGELESHGMKLVTVVL